MVNSIFGGTPAAALSRGTGMAPASTEATSYAGTRLRSACAFDARATKVPLVGHVCLEQAG